MRSWRKLFCAALVFAILAHASEPKNKRAPDVEVLQAAAARSEGLITVDARVRNVSAAPLKRLTLVFRFSADAQTVTTTQRISVDESVLSRNGETEIHGQFRDEPRAVQFEVLATDTRGFDLRVINGGPFPVE